MNDYSRARKALKEALAHQGSFDHEEVAVRFAALWFLMRVFDWGKVIPRNDAAAERDGEALP